MFFPITKAQLLVLNDALLEHQRHLRLGQQVSIYIYIICESIVYREYLCRNVRIASNEVTRTVGNGIMIKSESLSKSYWADQVCIYLVPNVKDKLIK